MASAEAFKERPVVCKVILVGKNQAIRGKVTHWHPQGRGADADDLGIVPAEDGDQLGGEEEAQRRQDQRSDGGHFEEKEKGLPDPAIQLGPVIEAAHRLVALTEAHQRRTGEHRDAGDDAHGRHGHIAAAEFPSRPH